MSAGMYSVELFLRRTMFMHYAHGYADGMNTLVTAIRCSTLSFGASRPVQVMSAVC